MRPIILILFLIAALMAVPPVARADDPGPGDSALGIQVLEQIAQEDTQPKLSLKAADTPALSDWATCALNKLNHVWTMPLVYAMQQGKFKVRGQWNCQVMFVDGTLSTASLYLYNGAITEVKIATGDEDAAKIRAEFIKETICTRLALENHLFNSNLAARGIKLKLTEEQTRDYYTTFIDGLAVICLSPVEREVLNIPDYVPATAVNKTAVCKAIQRMSDENLIRPGGLGELQGICPTF